MLRSATVAEAVADNRVFVSPRGASAIDLIGRRVIEVGEPLAFVVRSPPASVLEPHFHTVDQFQVITDGRALFGRHPVRVGTVHYADAYSPYGPILALEGEWHTYATLRPHNIA